MKIKILTLIVSMLFISMSSSAVGKIANSRSKDIEPCLDIGRAFIHCFVFFPQYDGYNLTFFKITVD